MEDAIKEMVDSTISEDPSLFLVGIKLKGNPGNQRLIVLLDGDDGVTIDQCSKVSRRLAEMLEEKDLISGKYHLEVSSAGVDHPLQYDRQYRKNIGRFLKVTLKDGSKKEGELEAVNDGVIVLAEKEKKQVSQHRIKFEDIEKSIVLVSFK